MLKIDLRLPVARGDELFRAWIDNRQAAAREDNAYLRLNQQGNATQYVYSRLRGWGYLR